MATFKATIFKERMREDKTWSVFIRFTHNRKVRYIPTSLCVLRRDLTESYKFKNQTIINKCDEIIFAYRKKLLSIDLSLSDWDIDTIVRFLQRKEQDRTLVSFTAYFEDVWYKAHTELKGLQNYNTAVNSFQNFIGHDNILSNEVTVKALGGFCEYLRGKERAQSLYCASIVRIFNDMRNYYNDEDNGIVVIKNSLSRFKVPKQNVAEQRALSLEEIRKIFTLPYNNIKVKGVSSRHDLALDCFKLSFCLMGMNSVDLYSATEYDGNRIIYNRTKTADRRNDKARMEVYVHPFIKPLIEKYRGQKTVFNFCDRFSSRVDFNRALNIGLKEIGKEIGADGLQFYAARHSFATIAVNDVGIPIYIVNDMLCHVDTSMRITMLYVKKDFKPMNKANFEVLDFVLNSLS